jgi:hypothetical protein
VSRQIARLCKLKLELPLGAASIEAPPFAAGQLIAVERPFAGGRLFAAEEQS